MTRNDVLDHLIESHGARLAQVGLLPIDSQESLFYVIDDALRSENALGVAGQKCDQLIYDRAMALGVDEPVTEGEINVSDI